jgi:hypothetical protein
VHIVFSGGTFLFIAQESIKVIPSMAEQFSHPMFYNLLCIFLFIFAYKSSETSNSTISYQHLSELLIRTYTFCFGMIKSSCIFKFIILSTCYQHYTKGHCPIIYPLLAKTALQMGTGL